MAKENIISKLKWIGVIVIISSIVSFILIPFLDYFSDKVLKFDLSTTSPYIITIVLGFSGSILLISYYILSQKNRNDDDKWKYFPART
jgi:riboflavin transporter FmnP